MDMDTCDTKDDLKLPEGELGDQIKQAFDKDEAGVLVCLSFSMLMSLEKEFFSSLPLLPAHLQEINIF